MREQTLTHHGVLGMKWGVRRFQNKDGSLTNRGKKRYSAETERAERDYRQSKKDRKKAYMDWSRETYGGILIKKKMP